MAMKAIRRPFSSCANASGGSTIHVDQLTPQLEYDASRVAIQLAGGAELNSRSSVSKLMLGCAQASHVKQRSIDSQCLRVTSGAPEHVPAGKLSWSALLAGRLPQAW